MCVHAGPVGGGNADWQQPSKKNEEEKKAWPADHIPRSYWLLSARAAEGKFKIVVGLIVFVLIRGASQKWPGQRKYCFIKLDFF